MLLTSVRDIERIVGLSIAEITSHLLSLKKGDVTSNSSSDVEDNSLSDKVRDLLEEVILWCRTTATTSSLYTGNQPAPESIAP